MAISGRRIVVVEDDSGESREIRFHLEHSGYQMVTVFWNEALELLQSEPVDLLIADLGTSEVSRMDVVRLIRQRHPELPMIVVAGHGSIDEAMDAIRCGVVDYLTKPVHPDDLHRLIDRTLQHQELTTEVTLLRSALNHKYGFANMIGRSNALMEVLDSAARVAETSATVLILGESGTGKEVLAKAIHYNSPRREKPFAVINCASIPRELLESELFGYVKGSFTGAFATKRGKVEIADGGTVFLDEIGEMPLDLQVRVLRLIQEREIEKVGGTGPTKVDVRIIAATHRNLENLVAAGTFREDLYYRLAVIPIRLPPLRERSEDIEELVVELFGRSKLRNDKPGKRLPKPLLPFFSRYQWPGNIRELENVVERIVVLSRSDEITVSDLPDYLRQGPTLVEEATGPGEMDGLSLGEVERDLIVQALRKFDWNQTRAARYLDITRKTLMYRIAKHGIEKETVEPDPHTSRMSG